MRNVREQGREGTGREGTGRARDLWLLDARPTKLRQVWGGMGVTQRRSVPLNVMWVLSLGKQFKAFQAMYGPYSAQEL